MGYANRVLIATALAATTLTAACVTDPVTGERRVSKAAIGGVGGAVGGYLLGDLVGGRNDRTEKIVGAGIGGLAGAGIGAYMDRQEQELRRRTAGTDVHVIRQGDDLVLNMPSGVTFATNQSSIQPQFRATLDQVADVLRQYNQTYVDVYGHTDSTGSDSVQSGPVAAPRERRRRLSDDARRAERPARHARLRREPADREQRDRGRQGGQPPGRDQAGAGHPAGSGLRREVRRAARGRNP